MASVYTQSAGEMAASPPLALTLFINRRVLARGGMNVGQWRSFSQTASRSWFIHDPNGVPARTNLEGR